MKEYSEIKETKLETYKTTEYRIITDDGFPLNVTIYEPLNKVDASLVLMNCATGITQKFYEKYSVYLVNEGCIVITWDYRGMGKSLTEKMKSKKEPLKDFYASISLWASKDHKSIVDFIRSIYSKSDHNDLVVIGHSLGAQIPLLCPNKCEITRLIGIGVGNPHWKHLRHPYILKVASFFGKIEARIKGYKDSSHGLQKLPKEVYLEWMQWVSQPNYLAFNPRFYNMIRTFDSPVLGLAFTDDDYMLKSGFLDWYSMFKASNEINHSGLPFYYFHPSQFGLSTIAHNGFFNLPSKHPHLIEKLWEPLTKWIKFGEIGFVEEPIWISNLAAKL